LIVEGGRPTMLVDQEFVEVPNQVVAFGNTTTAALFSW
jgi:hypothetical protein